MVALNEELSGIAEEPQARSGCGAAEGAMTFPTKNQSNPRSVPYCSDSYLLDSDSSRHYARSRNYSPSIGRFTSQDPLQFINGANTYQFVMSNPVGNVDPWGTAGIGIVATGSAGGGAVTGAGATGSVGGGVFVGGNGASVGGFASRGAAAGGPGFSAGAPGNTGQADAFGGAYIGAGLGIFLTNAGNAAALGGPFWQWNFDTELGSVSFECGNGVWLVSLTFGPGAGASGTAYSTTTKATAAPQPSTPINPYNPYGASGPTYVPNGPSLGFW